MSDPRAENLAKVLVNYSIKVRPGDWVIVQGSIEAAPLVNAVERQVLLAGGHPDIFLDSDDLRETFLREASESQLQRISPVENLMVTTADAFINLRAPQNTRVFSGIEPEKQRLRQTARKELFQQFMQRAANGDLHWVVTEYPCQALAQDAEMSLRDYENFVYSATFADQDDPVGAWEQVDRSQARLVDWLKDKDQVILRGPNCDLQLSISGRTFINCSGSSNMPDGEIFTGPVEESVNGWVRFTYPAIHAGREVEGIELEFRDGRVVSAKADKNEEYLLALIDSDPGARYVGEFAIGTNYGIQKFTRSILFDEKIGGSFHMALGAGYPESGSKNESSLHWDMICDMRQDSEILVDGVLFYKNGNFQV
jgi:aminopeptidase